MRVTKLDQLEIRATSTEAKVYLIMPSFKYPMHLATLFRDTKTLCLIPRSSKNVFHLFKDGLGFNEEMILKLDFQYLTAELNGITYRTTRSHLLDKAIRSPYQNSNVDRQLILRLKDFFLPDESQVEVQKDLFSEVANV